MKLFKTIYEFKKGDYVVRVVPAKALLGGFNRSVRDRSYLGKKLIFIGIANGQIYLQRTDDRDVAFFGPMLNLPLDIWDDGWELWIDPESLFDTGDVFIKEGHYGDINERLKQAIDDEDYELANKLNKIIEKNGKKK